MKSLRSTDITGAFIFSVLILISTTQVNGVPLDFLNDLFGTGSSDDSAGASADLSAGAGAAGSAALSVDKDSILGHKGFDASIAGAGSIEKDLSLNKGGHKDVLIEFPTATPAPPRPMYEPYDRPLPPPPGPSYAYPRPPPPHPYPTPVRPEDCDEHGIPLPAGRRPLPYHQNPPPPNYRNAPRPIGQHAY